LAGDAAEVRAGERTVRITSPGRVYFPARGETKLDLARYYLAVGDGIVRALRERPCMLHRLHVYVRIEPRWGFAELGDLHAGIDDVAYSLETLLEWADSDGLD
jgi:hypothetical protein